MTRLQPRALQAELQQRLDAAVATHRVPGATVGIVVGARDVVAVSGVTSVDHPLPVDDSTLFMVGSTTKTFTATALMRLADRGDLSLDDRVVDHLPDFRLGDRRAARAVTLRHLVTHTCGWDGDIDLDTGWGDDALQRYVAGLREQPQEFPPGEMWSYNNSGFCVAGRVIEVVTGTTFERAVTDLVLRPLGMHGSFFSPVDAATRRFAAGHISGARRPQVAHAWGISRSLAPAGGLLSTVRDQLTWARFHLGDGRAADGTRVLRARTMRLMQSDLAPAGAIADTVGVSWLIRNGSVRRVTHGGNVSNLQLSTFLMAPQAGVAVTVMTNAGNGRFVAAEMERWAMERVAGLVEPPPVYVEVGGNNLTGYLGTFTGKLFEIDVSARGRRLLLAARFNIDLESIPEEERDFVRKLVDPAPKPVDVGFLSPDRVAVMRGPTAGMRGEFLRATPGGPVEWLRWGGRVHRRVAARPG